MWAGDPIWVLWDSLEVQYVLYQQNALSWLAITAIYWRGGLLIFVLPTLVGLHGAITVHSLVHLWMHSKFIWWWLMLVCIKGCYILTFVLMNNASLHGTITVTCLFRLSGHMHVHTHLSLSTMWYVVPAVAAKCFVLVDLGCIKGWYIVIFILMTKNVGLHGTITVKLLVIFSGHTCTLIIIWVLCVSLKAQGVLL